MHFTEILLIAFSLGIDALAVSVSLSLFLKNPEKRQKFRIFFHFGLFQFLFPIVGYYLILIFNIHSGRFGNVIGGIILIILGLKMFVEGFKKEDEKFDKNKDLTRGFPLILFSAGVSIDALSVGVSMALIKKSIWFLAIMAGILTSLMSYIGIGFGKNLGLKFGEYSEFLGGTILFLLGIKVGFF
ncbi:conserved hypothetical protein [Thermotomaculum hydrothermale]|uniref:Manganese efflux pump MntP n=1 Tax=Thermotomaculum hydrothermale TaxID=981385 RepID=A0A7R6PMT1_9BACT|nr:manganese efflux pump [Thermotomaculum hydrothermale]BBB32453.1 conserved hypothetical protein [Thermotomaculum hydrothermale]